MTTSTQSNNQTSTREFKHNILNCLNKLSDRDTHSSASSQLQSIAKNLPPNSISLFISSISVTNDSDNSLVRKQCVRLIGTISEYHGHVLSSFHLSKLVSYVIRRLRDHDTSVRSACVDAVSSIAVHVIKPSLIITSVVKPLVDALVTEQDPNSQIGAALCLATAVDGARDLDVVYLRKMMIPKIEKLLKCESFKAKPALLTVLRSLIGVGAASSLVIVRNLVSVLVEFVVKSEDWSARKAAAEGLERLAVVEADLLSEFKDSCLKTFEAKKFDKVKSVRETMNHMIEAWKAIPDVADLEELTLPGSQSSCKGGEVASDGRYPPKTPRVISKTNGSSTVSATRQISLENSNKKTGPAMFRKLDRKKPNNDLKRRTAAAAAPRPASPLSMDNDHVTNKFVRTEIKRALFNETVDEEISDVTSTVVGSNVTDNTRKSHKDTEELSLIRNQLVQIETQQSNLFDLLQKFIGSSQTGMRSLETRVHGLEITLDEISFDLAKSTGRLSSTEPADTLCCKLPGASFLTSKLWKKTEIQHLNTRISSSPFAATSHINGKNMNLNSCDPQNRGLRRHGGGNGLIKNPLAEVHRNAF